MLLRTAPDREARILARVGYAFGCAALAAGLTVWASPFKNKLADQVSLVIDTPYVGQGVGPGTPFILHGVPVGKVTGVTSLPGGGVRLNANLQALPIRDLTDAVALDFRPANYFGVTGINLVAQDGGTPLSDGLHLAKKPAGDYTLQRLLSRLGDISDKAITPQLVAAVEKATRYTDAFNPLIETMIIAATAVSEVQKVSTEHLMANTAGLSSVFPAFIQSLTTAGDSFVSTDISTADDDMYFNRFVPTLDLISGSFFGALGKLLSSHSPDLQPAVDLIKTFTDIVPGLVLPEDTGTTLAELRSRFERMYQGSPEQRAMQIRIVLDALPGVSAPIGQMGGPR